MSEENHLLDVQGSPEEIIRGAINAGSNLAELEKLLTLKERWDANEARKKFALSFASAQQDIASVVKRKMNPQTHSKYADLGDVIESAKPVYTEEGFSVIFYEGDTPLVEHIRIYADVLHSSGHKETYHYDVPLDGMGIKGNANMTKIHAKASSTSYGRRYLMCMIWNIPTQDDDGNKATIKESTATLTDKQVSMMLDILDNLPSSADKKIKFLRYMEVESVKDILAKDFEKGMNALKASQERVK